MKALRDILTDQGFIAGFGLVRAVEPTPIPEPPTAEGLDVFLHGNADIEQSEWVYAEEKLP